MFNQKDGEKLEVFFLAVLGYKAISKYSQRTIPTVVHHQVGSKYIINGPALL